MQLAHLLYQVLVRLLDAGVGDRFLRVTDGVNDIPLTSLPVTTAPAAQRPPPTVHSEEETPTSTSVWTPPVYLVLPKLSSRAHFILLAPMPPLVDRAPPCPPGDAMATDSTAGPQRQSTC